MVDQLHLIKMKLKSTLVCRVKIYLINDKMQKYEILKIFALLGLEYMTNPRVTII